MPPSIRSAYVGRVYRRAFPQAKKAAALHGHGLSTEYEWRDRGSPIFRELYSSQPWVLEGFLAVLKAQSDVDKWPLHTLHEREKQLDTEIMQAVAEMVRARNTPGASLEERSDADQRLIELLAERQAVGIRAEEKRQNERGH